MGNMEYSGPLLVATLSGHPPYWDQNLCHYYCQYIYFSLSPEASCLMLANRVALLEGDYYKFKTQIQKYLETSSTCLTINLSLLDWSENRTETSNS